MIKYYYIDTGIKKSHRLRNAILSITGLTIFCLGIYSAGIDKHAPAAETTHPARQAAQMPAAAVEAPKVNTPLPWPGYGHAAYAVPKESLVATSGKRDEPVPVASLAKVITALAILKQKPLNPGASAPPITFTQQDVAIYEDYVRKNGSVLYVEPGMTITQYQALQAILMVSANNVSDSMVIQLFGSMEAYTTYANQMLKDMGIHKTIVTDASGYAPTTMSTAEDMTKLGYLYMQNPVLRQIAETKETTLPVAGKIKNYNSLVNKDGIVGIKVGDTDQAGKCFMGANIRKNSDGSEKISVAVVLGADHIKTAAEDAQKILKAAD